jgi:hypothetical protein
VVNLRQAFNAGVLAFWGVSAITDIHTHHIEEALLDIAFGAGVIFLVRHINQKPSP